MPTPPRTTRHNVGRRTARHLAVVSCVAALALAGPMAVDAVADPLPRLDLRVLVVDDGNPWTDAIRQELDTEGVPSTVVASADPARPVITAAFLAEQLPDGTPHARFNAVVVPSSTTADLTAAEHTALIAFELQFGVREVDAFEYPGPGTGQNPPTYAGPLDGVTATVTPAARAAGFGYLAGPVRFEDNDPAVPESFAYLSTPLPDDPVAGTHFEPYLTAAPPGGGVPSVLAGVFRRDGREQLVLGVAANYYQLQSRLLAHGIVDWVTRGVHLGQWRNYLTVHVDDLFSADSRWSTTGHCTPGEGDCAAGVPAGPSIRMTAADVGAAVAWQQQNGFTLDLLYNAAASDEAIADNGSDPLTTAALAERGRFRWLDHTYSHQFLGCVQDFTVIPWRCATDPATGDVVWTSRATIDDEIDRNVAWATAHGVSIRPAELVGGEHSGTRIQPQQPVDNPNFVASLAAHGIGWLGMDASREPAQRGVGSAQGVPRHPINIFYNVGAATEEVSEYNWIYTSGADGGSGVCTAQPATTTCITPLDPATGFAATIVPEQVQIMLGYVLTNDPRPFYIHQSNLAEDRLAYPTLSAVLTAYRAAFAADAPVVDQTMTAAGEVLRDQASWAQLRTAGTVSAYVQGTAVTVTGPAGATVPITVPAGTVTASGAAFGADYAGERSGALTVGPTSVLTLPAPLGPVAVDRTRRPAPQVVAPDTGARPDQDAVRALLTSRAALDSAPRPLTVPMPNGPVGER